MIEKVSIVDAEVIEQVRTAIPVVTPSKNGLMSVKGFIYKGSIKEGTDFNNIIETGYYQYYPELGNVINAPSTDRIVLLCFVSGSHIAQIAISVDPYSSEIHFRGSFNSGNTWNKWS